MATSPELMSGFVLGIIRSVGLDKCVMTCIIITVSYRVASLLHKSPVLHTFHSEPKFFHTGKKAVIFSILSIKLLNCGVGEDS